MMKKAFALLLCAALVFSIAGCKTSSAKTGKSSVVTISWFTESSDADGTKRMQDNLLGPFEKANPNIKIKWEPTANWDSVLTTELSAGNGPDVFNMDGPSVAIQYNNAGRMLDLDKYSKQYDWADKIYSWAYNASLSQGKLISLPTEYEGLFLWYNKDLFQKNGWQVPKTNEELTTLCKDQQSKGIIPFMFGTSDFKPANEWWYTMALNAYLGPDVMKQVLTGGIKWTDPQVVAAVTYLDNMWQQGWINAKQSQAITTTDAQALFAQQKAAMDMEGSWELGTLESEKITWDSGVALFPSLKDGVDQVVPLAVGESLGANAATKHPDECAVFLNWYYHDPKYVAQLIAESPGSAIPMKGIKDSDYPSSIDPKWKEVLDLTNDAMSKNEVGYASWTFWPPDTMNYITTNFEQVFMKTMTVQQYLEGTETTFEKEQKAGKLPTVF